MFVFQDRVVFGVDYSRYVELHNSSHVSERLFQITAVSEQIERIKTIDPFEKRLYSFSISSYLDSELTLQFDKDNHNLDFKLFGEDVPNFKSELDKTDLRDIVDEYVWLGILKNQSRYLFLNEKIHGKKSRIIDISDYLNTTNSDFYISSEDDGKILEFPSFHRTI